MLKPKREAKRNVSKKETQTVTFDNTKADIREGILMNGKQIIFPDKIRLIKGIPKRKDVTCILEAIKQLAKECEEDKTLIYNLMVAYYIDRDSIL